MAAHFGELLGIEHLPAPDGVALLELPVQAQLCNRLGTVHGGVLMSLLDTAGLWACAAPGTTPNATTVSLTCSFLAPATLESTPHLTARADVVKRGRSMTFCSIVVTAAGGRPIAMAQGTFLQLGGRRAAEAERRS
jgi:uncharacterized protein (TIGR00369 family)